MPLMVPVEVGLARGAFKLSAYCVALEIGLIASVVLSSTTKTDHGLGDDIDGSRESRAC